MTLSEAMFPGWMPTLPKQDREWDDLSEADEHFILRAVREIVEDLGERQASGAGC
jgi:hypothetical protein